MFVFFHIILIIELYGFSENRYIVLDKDGKVINEILCPDALALYFGDDRYMFSNFFDYGEDGSGAGTMFWYIPKDEVSTATEWTRLTDKSIHLIDELELRKRSK